MKAFVLNSIADLKFEKLEDPVIHDLEALISIKASGICASDIPRIFKTGTYKFPLVCGHEFCGVVEAVYNEEYKHLIGKRVGVFPLIPCKKCTSCKNGIFETCDNYDYLGSRSNGGFAEKVAVPIWNLIELPENVSFEEGAMLEPIAVALHAIKQVEIGLNTKIAIYGSGTIGFLIAMWARKMGAKEIFLFGTRKEHKELASKLGFINFCNVNESNPIQYILKNTNNVGADICIEAVGTIRSFNDSISSAKKGGQVLLVGNPNLDFRVERDIYWKILRNQLKVIGTWNSRFNNLDDNDWTDAIEAIQNRDLNVNDLITHKIKLEDLQDMLKIMKYKKEYYNKVMIIM